uniref:Uncharacterized protein n=1 Tax=Romanomermis culicivorax TaxID=13658 RepID=A0A915KMN9_ROMCU
MQSLETSNVLRIQAFFWVQISLIGISDDNLLRGNSGIVNAEYEVQNSQTHVITKITILGNVCCLSCMYDG